MHPRIIACCLLFAGTLAGITARAAGQDLPHIGKPARRSLRPADFHPSAQESQRRRDNNLAWQRRMLAAAFQQYGRHDPACEEAGTVGLGALALEWARDVDRPGDSLDVAARTFESASKAGCTDPLIKYLAVQLSASTLARAVAADRMREATRDMEASRYPPYWHGTVLVANASTLLALGRGTPRDVWAPLSREIQTASARALGLLPDILRDPDVPDDVVFAYMNDLAGTLATTTHRDRFMVLQPALDAISAARGPDSPMLPLARGWFQVLAAWDARGTSVASQVPEAAWPVFYQRLADAEASVASAARLGSSDPAIPAIMMRVGKGIHADMGELDAWFHHGIDVEPGDRWWYEAKLDWLLPKWFGSEEEALAFGREMASSGNWHLRLPFLLDDVYRDLDAHRHLPPEACEEVVGIYTSYLNQYPDSGAARGGYRRALKDCRMSEASAGPDARAHLVVQADGWLAMAMALFLVGIATVVRWWYARKILAQADSPVLPEFMRLVARREGICFGLCLALLLTIVPQHWFWTLPIVFGLRLAIWHPVRRRLYNESWSFAAYVGFFLRLTIIGVGYWLLVAASPALIAATGPRGVYAAIGLGVAACAWLGWYLPLLRRLLRTHPVANRQLAHRFDQMVEACHLSPVILEQFDVHGGTFANAFAVPGRSRAVVMSETLVDALDTDEALAICAHELAHLEQYSRRRSLKISATTIGLTAAALVATPVTRLLAPEAVTLVAIAWPAALTVFCVVVLRRRQKFETASDLRAVEITGDAEALCRALIKLHDIGRVARRSSVAHERQSTHPTLARRLRDIRTAAGLPPEAVAEGPRFTGINPSQAVMFCRESLRWIDGDETVLRYDGLIDLRLDMEWNAHVLSATDINRRERRMRVAPGDAPRLQQLLDQCDAHLASPLRHREVWKPRATPGVDVRHRAS